MRHQHPVHPAIERVRDKVIACRRRYPAVMAHAKVSRSWLSHFAAGQIPNPSITLLQAVSDACDAILTEPPQQRAVPRKKKEAEPVKAGEIP